MTKYTWLSTDSWWFDFLLTFQFGFKRSICWHHLDITLSSGKMKDKQCKITQYQLHVFVWTSLEKSEREGIDEGCFWAHSSWISSTLRLFAHWRSILYKRHHNLAISNLLALWCWPEHEADFGHKCRIFGIRLQTRIFVKNQPFRPMLRPATDPKDNQE